MFGDVVEENEHTRKTCVVRVFDIMRSDANLEALGSMPKPGLVHPLIAKSLDAVGGLVQNARPGSPRVA